MATQFTFRECFTEFMGLLTFVYFTNFALILVTNDKLYFTDLALITSLSYALITLIGDAHSKVQYNPAITLSLL